MKKNKDWTEKEKKIVYGIICSILIIMILLMFLIDAELPYKTGIVTAITGA